VTIQTETSAIALHRSVVRASPVGKVHFQTYEHRCRKPCCGHVERADDSANRRCPTDNRALWTRPLPKKGIVFHSLRHTTATLLARAKVHPSVAQKILRHANIETTLAIYTHVDGIEGCAPRSRSSISVRSKNAHLRPSSRSEKTRPLLPICYRQPLSQKMRPLTVPTKSGRSGASIGRGDWI
jgi:hypothetical protein